MLETIAIYLMLFTMWLEPTFGTKLSNVKGLSLGNLAFLAACGVWAFNLAFKRGDTYFHSVYKYFFGLTFIVILSIPFQFLSGEIRHLALRAQIVYLKGWLDPFLYFVLVFNLARTKQIIKRTTFGLMVVVMLSVIITLLNVTNIYVIGRVEIEHGGLWPVFAEPNQYAAYLVLMLPLYISYVLNSKLGPGRIVMAGCCVLILFALIASGSRGGILSFLISVIILLLILKNISRKYNRSFILGAFLVIALIFISAAMVPSWLKERTEERVVYQEGMELNKYSSGRLEIWKDSFNVFLDRPLLGHGLRGYMSLMEELSTRHVSPHNNYLQYLTDHGIVGLGFFILILSVFFKEGIKGFIITRNKYGIILFSGFSAGIVGYCVAIFFVVVGHLWSLVFIYCAVISKYAQLDLMENQAIHESKYPYFVNDSYISNLPQ